MNDIEFAVWFAGAAEAGWEPQTSASRLNDTSLVFMPTGAPQLSRTLASLAQSASAMHDAMLALAFADPEGRMDASGMAEATLARVAIESTSTALWLALPDDDQTRQRRYVSYAIGDKDDELRFGATVTDTPKEESLKKRYPVREDLVSTETTRVLKEVDRDLGASAFWTWQLYSGLAHGRPWAADAWRRNVPAEAGSLFGRIMGMLEMPLLLARHLLEVADLRRRFQGQTELEVERLARLGEDGPEEATR